MKVTRLFLFFLLLQVAGNARQLLSDLEEVATVMDIALQME